MGAMKYFLIFAVILPILFMGCENSDWTSGHYAIMVKTFKITKVEYLGVGNVWGKQYTTIINLENGSNVILEGRHSIPSKYLAFMDGKPYFSDSSGKRIGEIDWFDVITRYNN